MNLTTERNTTGWSFSIRTRRLFCTFTKEGLLQCLIHNLKYNNKPYIGELLGTLFGADLLGSNFIDTIDIIVPVPLHPKNKCKRIQSAESFAQGISKATSIPVSTNELIRVVNNPTQTKRSKQNGEKRARHF